METISSSKSVLQQQLAMELDFSFSFNFSDLAKVRKRESSFELKLVRRFSRVAAVLTERPTDGIRRIRELNILNLLP
jgi:hypothetical protein